MLQCTWVKGVWLLLHFRSYALYFVVEWWLLNFYYYYQIQSPYFNLKGALGSDYSSFKWINIYDYGWYVTYSGPALELLDFIDLKQLWCIFSEFGLLETNICELDNELVTTQIFVKSDTLGTKSYFLDAPQLDVNSLLLGLYFIVCAVTYYYSSDHYFVPLEDKIVECVNFNTNPIPFYLYDFYLYDFYSLFS